jgi:RNA polymerase sigma factor (TIGR02999 family)
MPDEATRLLTAIQTGDRRTTAEVLPLVYDELRQLAAARLNQERPGQTLQPTALVHEALLQMLGDAGGETWDSPGHFFGSVANAMRRILIDRARRKGSVKHGGQARREPLEDADVPLPETDEVDWLGLDESLQRLSAAHPQAAELVRLRFFTGLSMDQAAAAMSLSPRSAYYLWTEAREFLRANLAE